MDSCRKIHDCLMCLQLECLWTKSKKFPCRSGPDDTDNEIFTSCDSLNVKNMSSFGHFMGTTETQSGGFAFWVLGTVAIILLLILVAVDICKNSRCMRRSAQWSMIMKEEWEGNENTEMQSLVPVA